ncbi:MAG: UDP-N-acetylglucosamine--N-acetylmuramyl-(pentapeptide) pyrophosphoryl-undecaprenol [Verrucomicrobiota bacterium]|jgi:UDP-N-acetylglucosamine--N-acetylmuramyl-(pentapeptide) pyrophosphoryl-undecaprenol N-acetylglucosamine transferase
MKPFKAIIACGGTGGHLFPGLAVAETLHERGHEVLLFVSEKEIDATALKAHPEFRSEKLPSIGMPSMVVSPAFLSFLKRFLESYRQCRSGYRKYRPSVVLGMGGFTSTAPILAARLAGLPSFIHESNAIAGRANRLAAKFATRVLLGFEDCRPYFSGSSCVVTGTPVRKNLGHPIPREEALKIFNLDPSRTTLLVTGGSQGASGINQLLFKTAPLLPAENLQIIHLTGKNDDRLAAANYQRDHIPHYVAPFHHRMEEAYSAADIVVSRAGASSLSELAMFGLPSILIPYPYATDDHQKANAEIFVRAGAAELINEREIQPEVFSSALSKWIGNSERRSAMAAAARQLSPEAAAANVADVMERAVTEAMK